MSDYHGDELTPTDCQPGSFPRVLVTQSSFVRIDTDQFPVASDLRRGVADAEIRPHPPFPTPQEEAHGYQRFPLAKPVLDHSKVIK